MKAKIIYKEYLLIADHKETKAVNREGVSLSKPAMNFGGNAWISGNAKVYGNATITGE